MLFPSELLLVVFEWLLLLSPRTMLLAVPEVSTRWRDLCRQQVLVDLDLRWAANPACDAAIDALTVRFKRARTLDLSGTIVTDRGMALAAVTWPALTGICLDTCIGLTDTAVEIIATHCTKLECLNLAYNTGITDKAIAALAFGCKYLANINLSGCAELSDLGVAILTRHRKLQVVNLFACKAVTDRGIIKLAAGSPQLCRLSLAFCDKVTDIGVEAVARHCTQLRSIKLNCLLGITDKAVLDLVTNCPMINAIDLFGCIAITDSGVAALTRARHLQVTSLAFCKLVTTDGLAMLCARCPGMAALDIGCSDGYPGPAVTEGIVADKITYCTQLTAIDLYHCKAGVTDGSICQLASACHGLTYINLFYCPLVTDFAMASIAAGCPRLESLNFLGCEKVSDHGLTQIAYGCPELQRLVVCLNIGDGGLLALAKFSAKLFSIDLRQCVGVTDQGLYDLARGCPSLISINLSGCSSVTRSGLSLFPVIAESRPLHGPFRDHTA